MKRILKPKRVTSDGWAGFLKYPNAKEQRKSFAVILRKRLPNGTFQNKTHRLEALDAINREFKAGRLRLERATILARDAFDQLFPSQAILFNESNLELLKQYWNREYQFRDVHHKAAYNRLRRSIEAVGHCSLLSAAREELQAEVNRRLKGNSQRTAVAALNQLLKFFKRDIKLLKAREEIKPVRYVTEGDFKALLTEIKNERIRLLHEVAFATGLRLGEIFALEKHHLKQEKTEHYCECALQMDETGTIRTTKTRKARKAYILREWLVSVQHWLEIPLSERRAFRKSSHCKVTTRASLKRLKKPLVFHDLRHSYAIQLVSSGVPLTLVAQSLGNSIRVAERYYSGFVLTAESINLIAAIFDKH
jgi:integrase